MKEKSIIMFLVVVALIFPSSIFAKENSQIFYTNMNGVELTEEQYLNLSKVFDENTIATLTQQQIDYCE